MALDSRLSTDASINQALAAYASVSSVSSVPHHHTRHADKLEGCQYTAVQRDEDTARVEKALRDHGYTAAAVQKTFGYVPPAHHLPTPGTPGPFYLRKRMDHRSASALPSHAPASGYEVLVRLFLIGVCVEGNLVEELLGVASVGAFKRLGLLHACPLAASQLQSFVQLYPLSLLPALATAGLEGEGPDSDLILATDWPPPVSCALEEEPVMYIGSDSLGLVRMAAVCLKLLGPRPTTQSPSHSPTHTGDQARDVLGWRRLLDLCTGCGVQGIALAKMCLLQNVSIQVCLCVFGSLCLCAYSGPSLCLCAYSGSLHSFLLFFSHHLALLLPLPLPPSLSPSPLWHMTYI